MTRRRVWDYPDEKEGQVVPKKCLGWFGATSPGTYFTTISWKKMESHRRATIGRTWRKRYIFLNLYYSPPLRSMGVGILFSGCPWFRLHFRSIAGERIYGYWPKFAHALILTRSRFELLSINFCKFVLELWPLIVRILFWWLNFSQEQQGP